MISMPTPHRILVAVDDSEASKRAVTYVAEMLGRRRGFGVLLVHILSPVPPEFREFGGSEDPGTERQLTAELHAARANWIDAAQRAAQPVLERARAILRAARVPASAIDTYCAPETSGKDVMADILQVARQHNCNTVVVGRESFVGLQELIQPHVADTLIHRSRGITIWVVE
jgi:nucleotide-binding universal stress UspA family protein